MTNDNRLGNVRVFDNNAKGYNDNSDTQYSLGKKTIRNAVDTSCKIVREKDLKKLRVLDVGSGNGLTTINLYIQLKKELIKISTGIEVDIVGIDISPNMLKMAKRNADLEGIKSIRFINKNVHEISEADGTFDIIFSNCTLQLCKTTIYKNFFDRLSPGGALVTQQGGNNSYNNLHEMAYSLSESPEFSPYLLGWKIPYYHPLKDELEGILQEAGFVNIDVFEEEYIDFDYKNIVEAFIHASVLLYQEQLPNKELKELFAKKYREMSRQSNKKYVQVHRLHTTAWKR